MWRDSPLNSVLHLITPMRMLTCVNMVYTDSQGRNMLRRTTFMSTHVLPDIFKEDAIVHGYAVYRLTR